MWPPLDKLYIHPYDGTRVIMQAAAQSSDAAAKMNGNSRKNVDLF